MFNLDATCRGVLITGQLLFFAQEYIPHISEFTFLLLNQVDGEPGGVARGASAAQLARSGRRTQDEEAQRDTSDRPALWLPWAVDAGAFRVFSQHQISACFLS